MNYYLEQILSLTRAKKNGDAYMGHCPCHDDKTPSLSITPRGDNQPPLVKCHAGCANEKIIYYFKNKNAWPVSKKTSFIDIINESQTIADGDPASLYLKNRGLNNMVQHKSLKYHPFLYERSTGKKYPALIAIITINTTPVGIQRIYLTVNGDKALVDDVKKSLGNFKGGLVQLGCGIGENLHLAEGVETALAVCESIHGPVCATLGAKNLSTIKIPKGVKYIHIWADKDSNETGQIEAQKAISLLQAQGYEVFLHLPQNDIPQDTDGIDWLDVYNKSGATPLLESLKNEKPCPPSITLPENLVCLADVTAEEVDWLHNPFLPNGKVTMIEGDPGIGKSWIVLAISAEVSQGRGLFGSDQVFSTGRNVLLLCSEDGLEDTIKPRLDKVGGDHTKIFAYQAPLVLEEQGENGKEKLRQLILINKPALIIIDPLVSLLGGKIDMHKANAVRAAMNILVEFAREFKCSILALRHLVKGDRSKALYRGIGSIDFTAVCRSILYVGKNPQKENCGAIFHIKSNLAPLAEPLGFEISNEKLIWTGKSELKIEDTMSDYKSRDTTSCLDDATEFLSSMLARGPVHAKLILDEAQKSGIAKKTIYRAKEELKILSQKNGSQWYWVLPFQDNEDGQDSCAEDLTIFNEKEHSAHI